MNHPLSMKLFCNLYRRSHDDTESGIKPMMASSGIVEMKQMIPMTPEMIRIICVVCHAMAPSRFFKWSIKLLNMARMSSLDAVIA